MLFLVNAGLSARELRDEPQADAVLVEHSQPAACRESWIDSMGPFLVYGI